MGFLRNLLGGNPGRTKRSLPLLPLRGCSVQPGASQTLFVGRSASLATLERAMGRQKAEWPAWALGNGGSQEDLVHEVARLMSLPDEETPEVEPPVEILLAEQVDIHTSVPEPDQIHRHAILAQITRAVMLPDGVAKVTFRGIRQVALLQVERGDAGSLAATFNGVEGAVPRGTER